MPSYYCATVLGWRGKKKKNHHHLDCDLQLSELLLQAAWRLLDNSVLSPGFLDNADRIFVSRARLGSTDLTAALQTTLS